MRQMISALVFAASLAGGAAVAEQTTGTVIELYTSQGCSSCPPADDMLKELASRDDVIPLALHVDYWDYIGWVDDLANPAFTARQQAFAEAAGARTIYTPQMVIGGMDHVIGSRPMEVMDQIVAHNARPDPVDITMSRSGDTLTIDAETVQNTRGDAVVQLVRYVPEITRNITKGENAGRTMAYVNVVYSWEVATVWDTSAPLSLQAVVEGEDPIVVIVQDGTNGPILGAAQLR
ncbi:hypothetical protein SAMN04488515_0744 [Cognatiyoonia koreensis]|uniref:DUF1223 domain-containing protein n=1 Tax=Cognatiyoonia koreensis TaxID=364200 RepID=A0A1I0NPW6_9RHOB|nr:DUF1223 domain-containing protein [Cognatiyoonia koreensis]SEW03342.1 hypothetical protein SAMN04488515_0744 [Cognatiyoonia koreensis]